MRCGFIYSAVGWAARAGLGSTAVDCSHCRVGPMSARAHLQWQQHSAVDCRWATSTRATYYRINNTELTMRVQTKDSRILIRYTDRWTSWMLISLTSKHANISSRISYIHVSYANNILAIPFRRCPRKSFSSSASKWISYFPLDILKNHFIL